MKNHKHNQYQAIIQVWTPSMTSSFEFVKKIIHSMDDDLCMWAFDYTIVLQAAIISFTAEICTSAPDNRTTSYDIHRNGFQEEIDRDKCLGSRGMKNVEKMLKVVEANEKYSPELLKLSHDKK